MITIVLLKIRPSKQKERPLCLVSQRPLCYSSVHIYMLVDPMTLGPLPLFYPAVYSGIDHRNAFLHFLHKKYRGKAASEVC